jgi:glycosyltransferase involved in cell wall biosynthesis
VLYLNGLSKDDHYRNVLKSLKVRYRDFGWMAEKKYQNTLGKIDLGLQVSFAETFNHVAAEHMIRGIPVITSCMVPVMDNLSQEIKKRLIVDDSDNPRSIKEKIEFLIKHPRVRIRIGQAVLKHVRKENEKRTRIARKALNAILDSD